MPPTTGSDLGNYAQVTKEISPANNTTNADNTAQALNRLENLIIKQAEQLSTLLNLLTTLLTKIPNGP